MSSRDDAGSAGQAAFVVGRLDARAVGLGVLVMAVLGASYTMVKLGLRDLPVFGSLTLRMALATIVLVAYAWWRHLPLAFRGRAAAFVAARYRPLSREACALSAARICYGHLAGRLSVDLTDSFVAREYVVLHDEAAEITTAGARVFTEFGIELPRLRSTRRHLCRLCLDWTERRPHVAGAIGAAITRRYFDLGWMERMKHGQAVVVTPLGRRGFLRTFGIDASEPGARTYSSTLRSPSKYASRVKPCRM